MVPQQRGAHLGEARDDRRALEIATTLALDPLMLLLDEPMAGLGQEDIGRISALIRRVAADRTVLMVEHNLSVVADLSDVITVLTRGRILAEGDYGTVSKNPEVREAYLGTAMPDATVAAQHLLDVEELHAWYGESHILHGMSFAIGQGEVVTLLGRNGAGKTTTLRAIMGIMPQRQGSVVFRGSELVGLASNRIARLGIAYCPEERGIFASLDVEENLLLPPAVKPGGMTVDEIYAIFPNLKERRRSQGTKLSGGEQQMLAIGRMLRTGAELLLLDEPTEGLAPVVVQQIGAVIRRLKGKGFTILLVEQNFHFAATLADRHYVVEHGQVIDMIRNEDVSRSTDKLHDYLGV